jgi:hypothetical protein
MLPSHRLGSWITRARLPAEHVVPGLKGDLDIRHITDVNEVFQQSFGLPPDADGPFELGRAIDRWRGGNDRPVDVPM